MPRTPGVSAASAALAAVLLVGSCSSPNASQQRRTTTTERAADSVSRTTTTAAPAATTSGSAQATTTNPPCTTAGAIAALPLEVRAAQVVVIPSLDFNVAELRSTLARGVGGVLFLGRATAPSDLATRITSASPASAIAPWTMADQEGGGVQRMRGAVDDLPWARTMGETMAPEDIRGRAGEVGQQLRAAGIDVDLAPVLDIDGRAGPSSANPAGRRSFSSTSEGVVRNALPFSQGLADAGVVPVVKHFPGLGGSSGNTDATAAATRPIAELRTSDLLPFQAAIDAGAPAVMVSNATVPGLTDRPASLSSAVVHDLLRDELGFHGLVITDSLSAEAIAAQGLSVPQAAVASLVAGSDLTLFGSTLDDAQTALLAPDQVDRTTSQIIDAVVSAVHDGSLTEARLNDAVGHIVEAKHASLC